MKILCSQKQLARGLAAVKPAVSSKSLLPVLTHILLDARENAAEGRVRIAATNLDLGIVSWIPAQVEMRGAIAVPSRVIADFVSTLPEGQVEMTLNAQTQTLQVRCGRMSANVKGIDAKEFPEMQPFPKESIQVALDAKGLREMFDRVVFAAATDDSRPVLTGMLAKFEQNRLTLGAADGFRLSVQHTGFGDASRVEPFSLITEAPVPTVTAGVGMTLVIPVKAMQEVGRLCTDQVEVVKLSVSPNKTQVRFTLTTSEVITQLIEGAYPDLTRVIPETHTSRAVVNASDLLRAARMVSTFVDKHSKANGLRLEADPANSRVIVMGAHAERGDGVGDVDAAIEGEAFKVSLQAPYLLAMLERVTAPQLAIEYLSGRQPMPVVVRPVGDDDFVHVMMPLVDTAVLA